ncbi:YetF domain-containing protein [Pseudonocardia sp.]|uniref:DUF421 domain-containing protein n=1 Tax=Pseudonocardia sp. TaxID=60912 RepID=UPI002603E9AE|nr:YetF domain-containing protein [Pseudonocardia sp.]
MSITDRLGVDLSSAAAVVLATIGMYLALLVLVRLFGQRSLSSMSGTDMACVVALGAVIGRASLLQVPTLGAGLIALGTLFVLQRLFLLGRRRVGGLLSNDPVVLVDDGRVDLQALRRARVGEDDLRQRLRLAGITRCEQVALAVLERNGAISVLRAPGKLDAWLAADLPGGVR